MIKLKTLRIVVLAGMAAVQTAAIAGATPTPSADALHTASWQDGNEPQLKALLPTLDAATRFARTVLTKPLYTYDYVKVSDYRFVDVEGNGRLSLVCRMNNGGVEVNSLLAVITPTSTGYKYDVISSNSFELSDLSSVIVDLAHDGRKELLVRTLDDVYKGARPVQTFTHVYKVVDGSAYQADTEFAAYYKGIREPEIQGRLRELAVHGKRESPELTSYKREEAAVLNAELERIGAKVGR